MESGVHLRSRREQYIISHLLRGSERESCYSVDVSCLEKLGVSTVQCLNIMTSFVSLADEKKMLRNPRFVFQGP